jgi:hypothetical protein
MILYLDQKKKAPSFWTPIGPCTKADLQSAFFPLNRVGFEVCFLLQRSLPLHHLVLTQASSRPSKGAAFLHETLVLARSKTGNLRISGSTAAGGMVCCCSCLLAAPSRGDRQRYLSIIFNLQRRALNLKRPYRRPRIASALALTEDSAATQVPCGFGHGFCESSECV